MGSTGLMGPTGSAGLVRVVRREPGPGVCRCPGPVQGTPRLPGLWIPAQELRAGVLRVEPDQEQAPGLRPVRAQAHPGERAPGQRKGTARPAARQSRPAARHAAPARGPGGRARRMPPRPPCPVRRKRVLPRRRRHLVSRSEGISSSPSQAHVAAVPSTGAQPYGPSSVASGLGVVLDPQGAAAMTGAEATRLEKTGLTLTHPHPEYIRVERGPRKAKRLHFSTRKGCACGPAKGSCHRLARWKMAAASEPGAASPF